MAKKKDIEVQTEEDTKAVVKDKCAGNPAFVLKQVPSDDVAKYLNGNPNGGCPGAK